MAAVSAFVCAARARRVGARAAAFCHIKVLHLPLLSSSLHRSFSFSSSHALSLPRPLSPLPLFSSPSPPLSSSPLRPAVSTAASRQLFRRPAPSSPAGVFPFSSQSRPGRISSTSTTNLSCRSSRSSSSFSLSSPPLFTPRHLSRHRQLSTMATAFNTPTSYFLADQPPTVVKLAIKPHFDALSTKEKTYAHHLSV